MFRQIRTFEPIVAADGGVYVPRAYGDPNADGTWSGWLVFSAATTGRLVATDRQTDEPDLSALMAWADTLLLTDLRVALERARSLSRRSLAQDEIVRLEQLERDALADAERLERTADAKQIAATVDEHAAKAARAEAARLRRDRLEEAEEIAAGDERSARTAAAAHEKAAGKARKAASDATRRRQSLKRVPTAAKPRG